MSANKFTSKNINKFLCENCDFKCSKLGDYNRHLLTSKHIKANDANFKRQINLTCETCNNSFKHASSLSRHKKKCQEVVNIEPLLEEKPDIIDLLINENKEFKNVIIELFKNNSELQKQMMEVCKNGNVNNTTINNNSHNKTFNLQFFLNEQCKDAMNIMDFVNTFQLQFSDFEKIGEVGYVEGISKIIIDKLNGMDIYKRPIHCSDAKREIMYVKDKDVWEKENAMNSKLRLAIKYISKKNSDMVRPWLVKHPGALYSDHHLSDAYQMMIIESMGGNSGTLEQCENKIIRKISKMVLIDKKIDL
jgi:hypothetical protein